MARVGLSPCANASFGISGMRGVARKVRRFTRKVYSRDARTPVDRRSDFRLRATTADPLQAAPRRLRLAPTSISCR